MANAKIIQVNTNGSIDVLGDVSREDGKTQFIASEITSPRQAAEISDRLHALGL